MKTKLEELEIRRECLEQEIARLKARDPELYCTPERMGSLLQRLQVVLYLQSVELNRVLKKFTSSSEVNTICLTESEEFRHAFSLRGNDDRHHSSHGSTNSLYPAHRT